MEASRQEGRLTLQDMPGHEEQGDLCIEEFGLKPPGPRHVWCWVKDPTQPPRDAPEGALVLTRVAGWGDRCASQRLFCCALHRAHMHLNSTY